MSEKTPEVPDHGYIGWNESPEAMQRAYANRGEWLWWFIRRESPGAGGNLTDYLRRLAAEPEPAGDVEACAREIVSRFDIHADSEGMEWAAQGLVPILRRFASSLESARARAEAERDEYREAASAEASAGDEARAEAARLRDLLREARGLIISMNNGSWPTGGITSRIVAALSGPGAQTGDDDQLAKRLDVEDATLVWRKRKAPGPRAGESSR